MATLDHPQIPASLLDAGTSADPFRRIDRLPAQSDDSRLVQQTRNQIRRLAREIVQLARSDVPPARFNEGFLSRVVAALAGIGGGIWSRESSARWRLDYHVNLAQAGIDIESPLSDAHLVRLERTSAEGPLLIPPHSGCEGQQPGLNSSPHLLLLAPFRIGGETVGVVEIVQRAGGGVVTAQGYMSFLLEMCELASRYHQQQRLRELESLREEWSRSEQFVSIIYRCHERRQTTVAIANEVRRLLNCDRVSVAVRRGRKCLVESVSGVDTPDPRSAEVVMLGLIASRVVAMGEPLWHTGSSSDLAPQLEELLQSYIDLAHPRLLAVVPLGSPVPVEEDTGRTGRQKPVGALVIEQFAEDRPLQELQSRTDFAARHSAVALSKALERDGILMLPLWQWLGTLRRQCAAASLIKLGCIVTLLLASAAALILVPANFDLAARGKLQPSVRHDIYARRDGVVVEVPVGHGELVHEGQTLARMRNMDLEVDVSRLVGQQISTREQILAKEQTLLRHSELGSVQQDQLAAELVQLKEQAENQSQQLALAREKEQQLTVRSPADGQIVTWHLAETLSQRPVQRGQVLMNIVDPAAEWELELYMPERQMGHLIQAARRSSTALAVSYALATHPGREFRGEIVEIEPAAEVRGEAGNTVLLRAAVDKTELPDLRIDTAVVARVHCGSRSVGFVWFRELIEAVQSRILFWF